MRTLIFDIETVGENWEEFDDVTKDSLTRWVNRNVKNETEKTAQLKDIKDSLGFSPLTGKVVAIGLYDVERSQGAVYYSGHGVEKDEVVDGFVLKQRTEVQMLREFWEGALNYDTFVTFNGRSFDVPFILHRSLANKVRPSCELMKYRYLSQQSVPYHIDLQDELTFYGAMPRRPSIHMFCRAYGIDSPKIDGVSGDDVAELFANKKFRDIALYNARDVVATHRLYEKWLENLAPNSFLNTVEF